LDRVLGSKHLRVGLVENSPWVSHGPAGPAGAEVKLIAQFAASLGATADWYWGGEQRHMEALQSHELDLLAGGIDSNTPWSKKVGITRPYFKERVSVGLPPGRQQPESLKGLQVAVEAGDETASYLAEKEATVLRMPVLFATTLPTAAPEWRLQKLGLQPTKFLLVQKEHVIAAPPGENGWLKRIQEFIDTHGLQTAGLLQQEETGR
jgi:polar amino acid transport system substrate-binding protein